MKLVELKPLLPGAIFDIKYSTTDNITGKVLYKDNPPRLDEEAAHQLAYASKIILSKGLRLVVFDVFRTMDAYPALQEVNNDPHYVLDPEKSNHCKGLAFDGTLATNAGDYLDMGTEFDDFTEKSHVGTDLINDLQAMNRALFSGIMAQAGFRQWPYEWYHFDFVGKDKFGVLNRSDS